VGFSQFLWKNVECEKRGVDGGMQKGGLKWFLREAKSYGAEEAGASHLSNKDSILILLCQMGREDEE